jgi:hypothetical protein
MSLLQKDFTVLLRSRFLEGHEQDQRCIVDPVLTGVLKRGLDKRLSTPSLYDTRLRLYENKVRKIILRPRRSVVRGWMEKLTC